MHLIVGVPTSPGSQKSYQQVDLKSMDETQLAYSKFSSQVLDTKKKSQSEVKAIDIISRLTTESPIQFVIVLLPCTSVLYILPQNRIL